MEPSRRNAIVDTLIESVEPASRRSKYEKKLSEVIEEKDSKWINDALDFIFSITTLGDTGRGLEAIGDELVTALQRTNSEIVQQAEDEDFEEFKIFIEKLARSQDTLGLGMKAARVSLQHERTFVFSEVFSDFRNIFTQDADVLPKNAVIIHSLKVHSHRDDKHEELYFAMDRDDLLNLKKVVERAITKHDTLLEMAKKLEIRVIDLKGDD